MRRYSVVVVTWQSAPMLEALVTTMNRHLESVPELVVVDNGSRDDPERAAREYRGQVRFIPLERNVGFGVACNIGVENASGSCLVMLNPYTALVDASLDELAAFVLGRRALAGPRLCNPDGSIQPSASGAPVGPWPWVGAIFPGRLQPPPLRDRTSRGRGAAPIRRRLADRGVCRGPTRGPARAGPFDPAIHLYAEDMDLGLRAARSGIPTWFFTDLLPRDPSWRRLDLDRVPAVAPSCLAARNPRAVARRAYGARHERTSWPAQRVETCGEGCGQARPGPGRERRPRTMLDAPGTPTRSPTLPAIGVVSTQRWGLLVAPLPGIGPILAITR